MHRGRGEGVGVTNVDTVKWVIDEPVVSTLGLLSTFSRSLRAPR